MSKGVSSLNKKKQNLTLGIKRARKGFLVPIESLIPRILLPNISYLKILIVYANLKWSYRAWHVAFATNHNIGFSANHLSRQSACFALLCLWWFTSDTQAKFREHLAFKCLSLLCERRCVRSQANMILHVVVFGV